MAKTKSNSSRSSKTKSTDRPKPMTPKAGVTRNNNGRRYGCGGKIKTK